MPTIHHLRQKVLTLLLAGLLSLGGWSLPLPAYELSEYQLKAAFLMNFMAFTEWPAGTGDTLTVCVYGPDPFGEELNKLEAKKVGSRNLKVRRSESVDDLEGCQVVFVSRDAVGNLSRLLERLNGKPVLTVADSPGAARDGVSINMETAQTKISFQVNLGAVRHNGLDLSSKLLRLATQVYQ